MKAKKIKFSFFLLLAVMGSVHAGEADASRSVDDNIHAMDRDRDGMVTLSEVRVYLETRNEGPQSFRQEVLRDLEARSNSRSCASPFSQSFYR